MRFFPAIGYGPHNYLLANIDADNFHIYSVRSVAHQIVAHALWMRAADWAGAKKVHIIRLGPTINITRQKPKCHGDEHQNHCEDAFDQIAQSFRL